MKCEFSVLRTLVQQTKEPGVEVDAVSEHIESCEACRTELDKLGGGADWWDEAGRWLAMDPAECGESDVDALNQHAIDLSFLAPPTHPEMLGRIGQYDVESLLGHGGMGIVFRAHDSDLQRTVAVKVLAPQWATSPLARQRFAREAEAAASVAHECDSDLQRQRDSETAIFGDAVYLGYDAPALGADTRAARCWNDLASGWSSCRGTRRGASTGAGASRYQARQHFGRREHSTSVDHRFRSRSCCGFDDADSDRRHRGDAALHESRAGSR